MGQGYCKVSLTFKFNSINLPYNQIMRESILNKVSALRNQKGFTQEELAEKLQVSRQTIIAIEKGNYTPSVLLALKIAVFFKLSVEDIFKIYYDPSIKTQAFGSETQARRGHSE